MRVAPNIRDVAAQDRFERNRIEECQLDAGRADIECKNPGIHGRTVTAEWASSRASAQDITRACTASARLVNAIGTRAPRTMPADEAPARYTICLASMLPVIKSGATRMSAWPATGDSMPLIAAAATDTALSKARGPSSIPPVIWPRSHILHKAAASMVETMRGLTVSTADRIATCGSAMP